MPDTGQAGEIPLHRGWVGTSVYGTQGEAGEIIPIYNRWKQKNTKPSMKIWSGRFWKSKTGSGAVRITF
mgnify:CR=1 FL=1